MPKNGPDSLSTQQRRCLRLVGKGWSSPEIAHELGISESTVNGYLATAVAKLNVPNRRRAAALLIEHESRRDIRENLPDEILRVDQNSLSPPFPLAGTVQDTARSSTFDHQRYLPRDEADQRGETGYENINRPLRTIAWVIVIALAIVVLTIAIGPLTDSAIKLARVINSYRN